MTAEAVVEPLVITEPGVYAIPSADYHRDPVPGGSLSSTGARRLIPPGCPAKFAWEREHGRPPKRHYDLGHVAHREVLGDGELVEVIDADDYRTKAAQAKRDAAHAEGRAPILRREYEETVLPMAAAIRAHPVAGKVFAPGAGVAEPSLFWWDRLLEPRIMCRARLDWLPHHVPGRRLIVPEYKTAATANPDDLPAVVARLGYHIQARWNLDAVEALLDLDLPPVFLFVFQEKEAPFVVTTVQLEINADRIARTQIGRALRVYRECTASGRWGGYSDEVLGVALPGWFENKFLEDV